MESGSLDVIQDKIYPMDYDNQNIYFNASYNNFLPMLMVEKFDMTYDYSQFEIYKEKKHMN